MATRDSSSKTFQKGSDFNELTEYVYDKIETEEREVVYSGAEPSMDVKTELKYKYIVTISKVCE